MRMGTLIALLLLLLSGCTTEAGRQYPVIGFGWVTVSTNQPCVVTSKVLGFNSGCGQTSLGLSAHTTVTVPTNSNILLDLRQ